MAGGDLPKMLRFTHEGKEITAVLVENDRTDVACAGGWTMEERCSICFQPLGHRRPFYSAYPLVLYVHADCIFHVATEAASRRPLPEFPSGNTRDISTCPPLPYSYPTYPFINHTPTYSYGYPYPSPFPIQSHMNPPYPMAAAAFGVTCPATINYNHHQPQPQIYFSQHQPQPNTYEPVYNHNATIQHFTPAHYTPRPPPSSIASSSATSWASGWTGLGVSTVVSSLIQSFFSLLFSNN
ncbi:hypothetical protein HPP92_000646 [Vanilla planifolia]|uniref:Uncharacterized protein n=1 Tax=Vanilla planifolia TaxID=51239 RepID=A0A835RQG0_VANPL|nr:hypothetical protein HPP92_000730 [Vanilla planifolia]KAG0500574.1 hypothetical protein HPP92_000646 [Vanilla planifolia]